MKKAVLMSIIVFKRMKMKLILLSAFVFLFANAEAQFSFYRDIRLGAGMSYNTKDAILCNSIVHIQATASLRYDRNEFITGLLVSKHVGKIGNNEKAYFRPGVMLSYTHDLSSADDRAGLYLTCGSRMVMQAGTLNFPSGAGYDYKQYNWITNAGIGFFIPFNDKYNSRFYCQLSYAVDYIKQKTVYPASTITTGRTDWNRLDISMGIIFGDKKSYTRK